MKKLLTRRVVIRVLLLIVGFLVLLGLSHRHVLYRASKGEPFRPTTTNIAMPKSRIMLETWQENLTPNMKKVAFCESSLRPDARGDGGKAIGLMQIRIDYWEVSEEEALDPKFAIEWAKEKDPSYWTCARLLKVKKW